MTTTTNIPQLKFNKLTESQYEGTTPVEGEFYITPDTHLATKDYVADYVEDRFTDYEVSLKTNCLYKVPQDVKAEININKELVLKAGSKVYVPNGFEQDGTTPHFDEIIIENDIINTDIPSNTTDLFFANGSSLAGWPNTICYSGPTTPTGTSGTWNLWYDTSNNIFKGQLGNSTWTELPNYSLPFCVASGNGTNMTKLHKLLNGITFMGGSIFLLPNVEFLVSNGFNEDSSFKNIIVKSNSIIRNYVVPAWGNQKFMFIIHINSSNQIEYLGFQPLYRFTKNFAFQTVDSDVYCRTYDEINNFTYETSNSGNTWTKVFESWFGYMTYGNPRITDIAISTPTQLNNNTHLIETAKGDNYWYRVYSDGFIDQGGVIPASTTTVSLLRPYTTTDYGVTMAGYNYAAGDQPIGVSSRTTSSFTVNTSSYTRFWRASGY